MSLLIPTFFINKITDLSPEFIKSHSVTSLLMDIDDTLTYHKDPQIPKKILEFINLMKANNIKIVIVYADYHKSKEGRNNNTVEGITTDRRKLCNH